MPLLQLQTTTAIDPDKKEKVMKELSAILSKETGKPETYIMITLQQADFYLGGSTCNGAFIDIKGIGGISPEINKQLSASICNYLSTALNLDSSNIYLNFTDVPASNWGWNGGTF